MYGFQVRSKKIVLVLHFTYIILVPNRPTLVKEMCDRARNLLTIAAINLDHGKATRLSLSPDLVAHKASSPTVAKMSNG